MNRCLILVAVILGGIFFNPPSSEAKIINSQGEVINIKIGWTDPGYHRHLYYNYPYFYQHYRPFQFQYGNNPYPHGAHYLYWPYFISQPYYSEYYLKQHGYDYCRCGHWHQYRCDGWH